MDQRYNRRCNKAVAELGRQAEALVKQTHTMKKQIHFFFLTGWLVPVGVALVFFGRWITEIVVPTLKGGNFDQLYDLHRVRYLDTTLACVMIAFTWVTFAVFRWASGHINAA